MVFQHSIPFAAPSQLRLELVPAPQGQAWFTVVDQFNRPMGNLWHMNAKIDDLLALATHHLSVLEAPGDKAICSLRLPHDAQAEDVEITYEDYERHRMVHAMVLYEDLRALIDEVAREAGTIH